MLNRLCVAFLIFSASNIVFAQNTPSSSNPTIRLRGTIEKVDASSITIKERRGETITLVMPSNPQIVEVYPISLQDIQAGSFIGTSAKTNPDGTLEALEVHVFPEAMRGTGEGHRPWDLLPDTTMTNATVSGLVTVPQGRQLALKYKDGEKTVHVAQGVPIVSYRPADTSLLVTGAKVFILATAHDGKPTFTRISVGRDGFTPPM